MLPTLELNKRVGERKSSSSLMILYLVILVDSSVLCHGDNMFETHSGDECDFSMQSSLLVLSTFDIIDAFLQGTS